MTAVGQVVRQKGRLALGLRRRGKPLTLTIAPEWPVGVTLEDRIVP